MNDSIISLRPLGNANQTKQSTLKSPNLDLTGENMNIIKK